MKIERGRHLKLSVENRICTKCNLKQVEDEFHCMMICSKCNEERNLLLNILGKEVINWNILDMEDKLLLIMKINSQTMKVANIIHHIMTCDNNYKGNKA